MRGTPRLRYFVPGTGVRVPPTYSSWRGCRDSIGEERANLPRTILGRTGLEVTSPALGGVGIGGVAEGDFYGGVTDETAVATVVRAVRRGVNLIDTAPLYQASERRVGMALRELTAEEREGVLLSTKVCDNIPEYLSGHPYMSESAVRSSVEHSLKVLGVPRVDLCLIHDLTQQELEDFLAPGGGMDGLRHLRREGLVGHLGLGTHDAPDAPLHRRFLDEPGAAVLLTVNDWNLLRRNGAAFDAALAADAGVLNAGVFYMGFCSGADPRASMAMGCKPGFVRDVPRLAALSQRVWDWAEARRAPLRALALQFAARRAGVSTCVVGCRTPEEVDEICDDATAHVPDELFVEFEAEFGGEVASLGRSDHWYYDKHNTKLG